MYFSEVCHLKTVQRPGRIFALVLSGVITLTACSAQTKREVSLSYPVAQDSRQTAERTVEWDDSAFLSEPLFDSGTAKICAVMCACAGNSDLAQEDLDALGFDKTAKFSYEKSYKGDRVGVLFSKKAVGDRTLVAVIIRGTVGKEWYSNFDIGYGKEHAGFASCADFVLSKLSMYTVNYGIDTEDCAFLVTGYSRGGAVANLVAKRLIDADTAPVYAYTFGAPNTTTLQNSERYKGIYNLVRREDFFTRVPLMEWGYHRYGTDIPLGEDSAATPDDVKSVFREVTGEEYVGFDDDTPVAACLDAAVGIAPTVDEYYRGMHRVGDTRLTMYEYMTMAARFLSKEERAEDIDLLIASTDSDFAPMTEFFMNGIDMEELLLTGDFTRSSAADSHAYVSYLAELDNLSYHG